METCFLFIEDMLNDIKMNVKKSMRKRKTNVSSQRMNACHKYHKDYFGETNSLFLFYRTCGFLFEERRHSIPQKILAHAKGSYPLRVENE